MNKIEELRIKRAKLWDSTKIFLDNHRLDNGLLSIEDQTIYEKMEADVVALGREIERLERQAAIDRKIDEPQDQKPTDFANEGIRQADRMIDELDEFMKKLEDAGILSGWTQFMDEEDADRW